MQSNHIVLNFIVTFSVMSLAAYCKMFETCFSFVISKQSQPLKRAV